MKKNFMEVSIFFLKKLFLPKNYNNKLKKYFFQILPFYKIKFYPILLLVIINSIDPKNINYNGVISGFGDILCLYSRIPAYKQQNENYLFQKKQKKCYTLF